MLSPPPEDFFLLPDDSQDAKVMQADQKAAATTQKMTQATTEATTEEVTEATTEAEAESALPYTNNSSIDISSCQTVSFSVLWQLPFDLPALLLRLVNHY